MTDKQQTPNNHDAIAPAKVSLNARPRDARSQIADTSIWRQHRLAIIGLGISLAVLLAVVFLLPGMVSPIQAPKINQEGGSPTENVAAPTPAQGPTESPWRDAQFAKARREAQAILEKLLEKQKALEEVRVELWAKEDFARAQGLAEAADQLYRKQEFVQAQEQYQDSLEQFNELLKRSSSIFQSALAAGQQAILDGDATLAREKFQLAAHIEPDSEAVQTGLQRSAVLEDVLAEIEAGEQLQRDARLEAAKQRYQSALQLDGESQLAQQRLQEIDRAIAEQNFGKNMSAGFSAMSSSRYSQAIDAFQRALAIKPNAADARSALRQAQNEKTQSELQALLSQAKQHEQSEKWQAALDKYEQALAVDENLVQARVGAIRAGARADVDAKLESILESPERLTTPAVHEDYQAFYREALDINNPGPRLTKQLEQLQQALHRAVQPVTVQFRSDNATQVTVYRVGRLGSFAQTEITLKPGTYTVVGSRQGYRDVRQEFTVSANANRSPITIQCVEKIPRG